MPTLRSVIGITVTLLVIAGVSRFSIGHALVDKQYAPLNSSSGDNFAANFSINWPNNGEAALMVDGKFVGQYGSNAPLPTASLAKMMTAWLVLKKFPLTIAGDGPIYRVSAHDEAVYQQDLADGDSVAKVAAGESLTERQLLEALLLPSGNNIAIMLAQWVSGSVPAFVNEMNAEAKAFGMNNTHYSDPAGINPNTVSTAVDQLKITSAVMGLPAFKDIVSMQSAKLPVSGVIYNTNTDLGEDGIIGVKTGNLAHIGNMAVAAVRTVGKARVLVIGTVLGQTGQDAGSSLTAALSAGKNMMESIGY